MRSDRVRLVLSGALVGLLASISACAESSTSAGTLPVIGASGGQDQAPTTIVAPALDATVDPSYTATPLGECDDIVADAVGFRNNTGNLANEYRKLGTTWTGRSIWAEHWGPPVGPQVLLIGQVHGYECAPAWVVNEMRSRPAMAYGLWIIPTLNPDGLAKFTRENHNGIDLNRDGGRLESIEVRLLMDLVKSVQPMLVIHLHAPLGFIGTYNGASNGGIADRVAKDISRRVGWGDVSGAGENSATEGQFLWQGIDRALPGTPSILIELPSVSFAEAPGTVNRTQRSFGSVAIAQTFAKVIHDSLEDEFGAK